MNKEKEMVVPELRFSEFENEGDWKEKTLVNIAEIVTGTTPKTSESENYGGNKLFVSPADISGKRYISKTIKTLSEIGFSKSRVLPENSILFVCIGSTIGKIAQNKIECATNQQINSLIPFENYSNDFIYSLLENNSYRIASLAGHQAVPLINKTDFSEILVLLPPTKLEQQKIANCLSSLDNLITAETEKLDHLKDHKKGLLQQLFPTNGETKPQFRFLEFKNDGDWEEKDLKSFCYNISSGKDKNIDNGKNDLYGSTGIIGKTNNSSYVGNFILVARVGANAGLLNRAYGQFGVTDNTLVLNLKEPKKIDFIFYTLTNIGLNKLVFGSGQPLVTGKQLKELNIPTPKNLKEQQKIAN